MKNSRLPNNPQANVTFTEMFSGRVCVGGNSGGSQGVVWFFDTDNNNAQVGSAFSLAGKGILDMVFADNLLYILYQDTNGSENDKVAVYDIDNYQQIGDAITLSVRRINYSRIAAYRGKVAVLEGRRSPLSNMGSRLKIFDTLDNNGQIGSDIVFSPSVNSNQFIAMVANYVAVLDATGGRASVVKVFDIENNNAQVGSDVPLGNFTWQDIAMDLS